MVFDGNTLKDFIIQNWEMVLYFLGMGFFMMMVIVYPIYMVLGVVLRFLFPKVFENEVIG